MRSKMPYLVFFIIFICNLNLNGEEKISSVKKNVNEEGKTDGIVLKIANLEKMKKQFPDSGKLSYELSIAYFENTEIEKSLREIISAVKHVEKSKEKPNKLSDFSADDKAIYNDALEMIKKRMEEDAIEKMNLLLAKYPNSPELLYNLAIANVNLGKYKIFFEQLYKANSLNNDTRENYRILGRIHLILGNETEAENLFAKSLEIDQNYTPSYVGLGMLRLIQKEYDEGIYILKKAVSIDPQDYSALITLGHIYMGIGQMDKSKELFLKAMDVNKNYWEAYQSMGTVYYNMDDVANSIKMLKEVIVLRPNEVEPLLNLAKVYQMKGYYEDAIALYKSAIKLQPDVFPLYCELADLYVANNELENSVELYSKALSLDNKSPLAHYRLGLIYHKLKKFENAETQLKQAIQQKPDFIEAYQALYLIYRDDLNNQKEAEYYYRMLKLVGGE